MITQEQLELQNRQIVIDKAMNELEKARSKNTMSELKQVNAVIPYYVTELSKLIDNYIATSLMGKAKVKPVSAKLLLLLPTTTLAHYTIKTIVNHLGSKNMTATALYRNIATKLELEYNLIEVKNVDDKKFSILESFVNNSGYNGDRKQKLTRDLLNKYYKDVQTDNLLSSFIQVAQLCVYLLAESQPIVNGSIVPPMVYIDSIVDTTTEHYEHLKSKTVIIPAQWLLDWIRQQTLDGNMLPSYYTAMVEPPKPWVNLRQGGFYTEHMRVNFIKTNVENSRFDFGKMKNTIDAVNIIQQTPWEINKEILEIMNYAFVNKLTWGDMPCPKEILGTPYPYPNMSRKDMNDEQKKTVKAWAQHQALQHSDKASDTSRYLLIARILNEAKRFQCIPKLYFTYQVDFRGRIYPCASNLHPQGGQHVKALLRFSEGKPISDIESLRYFYAHGANTYGKDKLRIDEKSQWCQENRASILESAGNPILSEFWKKADEPWLFLAWCFEYRAYLQDPKNFLSKIPVALDGSCNGLQHLSAMMRDEVGGKQVNLTNNYNKEDIYNAVRLLTISKLESLNTPEAKRLLEFGIERSTCKRPVMIIPYAGTQNACRKYIGDDFSERGGVEYFKTDIDLYINLATKIIWEAIGEIVIKGREVMKWFKQASRQAVKYGETDDIEWTTPNGFQVIQRRQRVADNLIQTVMGDKIRLSLRLKVETPEVDISGHTTAISPNFIHSLDACALQNTVLECHKQGINSFAMIHDSYGTHAADTAKLSHTLRKVFVDMYTQNDVLQNWIKEQSIKAQEQMDMLPTKGKLDINLVLDSEHFFA